MKNMIPILALIVSLFISSGTIDDKTDLQNPVCYTKEGYVAATSEEYLNKAIQYSVDKDYIALQKLIDAKVIVSMKADIKVLVVKTHLFSGTVEFRLPGDTNVFWTIREALKCN